MPSPRFIATTFNDVRIVDGRLQIGEGIRSLLKGLLAPTDCPRAQLRHLQWTVDLLDEEGTFAELPDHLMLHAAKQLKDAIQVELSYEAFLQSSGAYRRHPAEFEFVLQAGRPMVA